MADFTLTLGLDGIFALLILGAVAWEVLEHGAL